MSLPDTRETVQAEAHYMFFDAVIDEYHNGQRTFEDAVACYRLVSGLGSWKNVSIKRNRTR